MSGPEQSSGSGPLFPSELPPDLAEFLRTEEYACVTEATNQGTVFVIKVPAAEIASVRGRVPILLEQALYRHPAAPVIRLVLKIFDQPESPLALETFINVGSPVQREHYAALAEQTQLPMLFYDEGLTHRLTKVIPYHQQQESAALLAVAERFLGSIPLEWYNFNLAKAAVMRASRL